MSNCNPKQILDEVMPKWHSREYHSIKVAASTTDVIEVAEELKWKDVPIFYYSINLLSSKKNRKKSDDTIFSLFFGSGLYQKAYRSSEELVIVGILPVSKKIKKHELNDVIPDFQKLNEKNIVKIAANFLYKDGILSTETRNLPIGEKANLFFSIYWICIYLGSGMIRRIWLRGIRKKIMKSFQADNFSKV